MTIAKLRLTQMAPGLGWLFACGWLAAQTISGSIVGTVADSTGGVIPDASIQLTASSSGAVRTTTSDARGDFSFNALQPDTYALTVTAQGFRRFEQSDISLLPDQRVSLAIALRIGPASEMVTVTGQPPQIHTNDTAASTIITPDEVSGVPIESRNFAALAELLPGVPAVPGDVEQGFRGSVVLNANGQPVEANSISIDGLATENSNGHSPNTFVSEDAIKEVTVLQYNYTAKYGRTPGLAVRATTKGGTQQYHGSVFWYQRDRLFDANDTFNNRQHREPPSNQFFSTGGTFGGPLIIPKLLPRQQKLFFFFDGEIQRRRIPQSIVNIKVPNDGSLPGTSNERLGDFSDLCPAGFSNGVCTNTHQTQLLDQSGKPYPNNNITAFINPTMQTFLSLLPLPNQTPATVNNNTNYFYQESVNDPRHTEFLRLDYNLTPQTILTASGLDWVEDDKGANVPAGSTKWGWIPADYNPASRTLNVSVTHVFSPTLTLQATGSMMYWTEQAHPSAASLARVSRSVPNINIPQFFPQNNPLNLLPLVTFSGMPSGTAPSISWDARFPINGREITRNLTVDLSKVLGAHTLDTGFYVEHWYMNKGAEGNFAGTFTFEQNTKTYALSTGNAFADAYLGNFYQYTEANARPVPVGTMDDVEWYAEDNWKPTARLTLEYGMRFGFSAPFHSSNGNEAAFVPALWNFAQQVKIYCGSGATVYSTAPGCSPKLAPSSIFIGAIDPSQGGNPFNGSVNRLVDPSYPAGFRHYSGLTFAPRFGFAFDPLGHGTTAIRGGFGIFYQMRDTSDLYSTKTFSNTPLYQNLTVLGSQSVNESNFAQDTSVSPYVFPSSTSSFDVNYPIPSTMSFNLDLQHQFHGQLVLDVAYVGSLSRHQLQTLNINPYPFGTTTGSSGAKSTILSQLARPYMGYNDITLHTYGGNSNYNALQVQLNRHYGRLATFGASYTWSKAMGYYGLSELVPRSDYYGELSYDHTHILKAHFLVSEPRQQWGNAVTRAVFNGWSLGGVTTAQSGAPASISVSGTGGSGGSSDTADKQRVNLNFNPSQGRAPGYAFNPAAIAAPQNGTFGTAPPVDFIGAGLYNWDLSLRRSFQLSEKTRLFFEVQAYNAFNRPEYHDVETTAHFTDTAPSGAPPVYVLDAANNPLFGQYTSAWPARQLQLALRLTF